MSSDPLIDEFLAYAQSRGIPERYRALYRAEVVNILVQCDAPTIDHLDSSALAECVRAAEKRLRNMRAVAAALDAFIRARDGREAIPKLATPSQAPGPPPAAGAPSHPPPAPSSRRAEHRRYARIPFTREVHIEGYLQPGRCSDLSVGGMYLETNLICDVGTTMDISFSLYPGKPRIKLQANVVYTDHGVGAGLDFVRVPPKARIAMQKFIKDFIARGGRGDW